MNLLLRWYCFRGEEADIFENAIGQYSYWTHYWTHYWIRYWIRYWTVHDFFEKNAWRFGGVKKKPYLCSRFREEVLSNGIKAITSDFGSENPGSIPGWTTREMGSPQKGSLFIVWWDTGSHTSNLRFDDLRCTILQRRVSIGIGTLPHIE